MDARIFGTEGMNLRGAMLELPLDQRLAYDAGRNILFVNFEGLRVRSRRDIDQLLQAFEAHLVPIGHKVAAIFNFERFSIAPDLINEYTQVLQGIMERHYSEVTRYTAKAFQRARQGG